jgi:hypothetical protein
MGPILPVYHATKSGIARAVGALVRFRSLHREKEADTPIKLLMIQPRCERIRESVSSTQVVKGDGINAHVAAAQRGREVTTLLNTMAGNSSIMHCARQACDWVNCCRKHRWLDGGENARVEGQESDKTRYLERLRVEILGAC